MSGFITKAEVEANIQFILKTWGAAFVCRCLDTKEATTFLALLTKAQKI